jgi:hypothetical protein
MDDVHLFSECFGDVCSPLGLRVLHGCFFSRTAQILPLRAHRCARTAPRAPLRAHRFRVAPLPQFSCACACAGPAAHAFGERSTTALDRGRESIAPSHPSPNPHSFFLSSQGWIAEGDADPTVLLMPAVPDPVQLVPWLPFQPGASPRSGGPRPLVRRAAAADTGPARSGPRSQVGPAAVAAARPACF